MRSVHCWDQFLQRFPYVQQAQELAAVQQPALRCVRAHKPLLLWRAPLVLAGGRHEGIELFRGVSRSFFRNNLSFMPGGRHEGTKPFRWVFRNFFSKTLSFMPGGRHERIDLCG